MPIGPTRLGPGRHCMWAQTLRSHQIENIASSSTQGMKTTAMIATLASRRSQTAGAWPLTISKKVFCQSAVAAAAGARGGVGIDIGARAVVVTNAAMVKCVDGQLSMVNLQPAPLGADA